MFDVSLAPEPVARLHNINVTTDGQRAAMLKKTVGARVNVRTKNLAKLAARLQGKTLSAWIADVVQDAARQQLIDQGEGHSEDQPARASGS